MSLTHTEAAARIPPSYDPYVDVHVVADYLGVKRMTIWRWERDLALPTHRLGLRIRRYKLSEIEAWVQAQREAGVA